MENSKINLDKIVLIEIPKQHETKIISKAYHFKLRQYINPLIIQHHPILKIRSIRQIWTKDGDEAAFVVVFKCIFILVYHLLVEANDILFSVLYFT